MITIYKKVLSVFIAVIMSISSSISANVPATDKKVFDISVDEQTHAILEIIKENSYLDIEGMITNLPDANEPARMIGKTLNLDTTMFREKMYELRDKYNSENDQVKAFMCYFIGAYMSVFEKCEVKLEPRGNEYEFILYIYYSDGTIERLASGTIYNPETGLVHGTSDKGLTDLGFEFDMNEMVVYATFNCWMRNFGFCFGYDAFCYLTPFFDYRTRRFKFDYDGKEWMIQVWKGKYIVANGAEVGVYNREPGSQKDITYYNCASDEDCLKMSFNLYHDDTLFLSRSAEKHWWVNGFKLCSDEIYLPNELTIDFNIEMKDIEMLKAFTESIDNNFYGDVTYTTNGLTVSVHW